MGLTPDAIGAASPSWPPCRSCLSPELPSAAMLRAAARAPRRRTATTAVTATPAATTTAMQTPAATAAVEDPAAGDDEDAGAGAKDAGCGLPADAAIDTAPGGTPDAAAAAARKAPKSGVPEPPKVALSSAASWADRAAEILDVPSGAPAEPQDGTAAVSETTIVLPSVPFAAAATAARRSGGLAAPPGWARKTRAAGHAPPPCIIVLTASFAATSTVAVALAADTMTTDAVGTCRKHARLRRAS